jgi:cell fate regulator YaaT (PSP1 superfamily)
MACLGCSCSTGKDSAGGCKSNGGCSTGGCNRHNTYDWISASGIRDPQPFDTVEVSFKNGSRKEFFKNPPFTRAATGDWVIVESASGGYDVGSVTLSGELVRLQMKRKRVRADARLQSVVRKAHERDLERLDEVRGQEKAVMVQARAIARSLDLDMKVGDVEFQGDGRKCTFYYTADGRVDFRELIRQYAREFKVKIEMRQIGARQESARIGGLGNCGRELCCSTWLTEFKSVNTAAARFQNLAINQTKLSGMCGRLKCCLNYELDTYIDALEDFPDRAERMKTSAGLAILVKTDVFKRLMYYAYAENRGKFFPLHVDQVWDALDMIKRGEVPGSLEDIQAMAPPSTEEPEEEEPDYDSVNDVLELPLEKRKKKKKKKSKNRDRSQSAAAAVEKAAKEDIGKSGPAGKGSGGGNSRQQRPPQRPQQGQGQGKPEGRPEQRKPNNGPQAPRPDRPERTERPDRPPRPERTDRPERAERPERTERSDRPEQRRPEQPEAKQQTPPQNRPPQQQQGPRPERPERPERPGQKPGGPRPEQRQQGPRPDNRPPRPERPERPAQPPAPPAAQDNKPPVDKPEQPGGDPSRNRGKSRGRDRYKGRPPKKED